MACPDDCVTYDELPAIIKDAVRQALDDYQHACILNLKDNDVGYVRDLVGAVREVGEGSLEKGIVVIRENHKFVISLHEAATKIGWGVIVICASVIGALCVIAAGVWKQSGGS